MSKPALRWFLFVLFVHALLVGMRAQQQDPPVTPSAPNRTTQTESQPPDAPIFRTGINFIQVDAIVTDDDGIPVRDLRAADFAVLEDGEPQTVESFESFELVDIRAGPTTVADSVRPVITPNDEARAASRVDTRIIVIFFDDYHVRWENGVRAGRTLAAFLRSQLYPTDLVGIMHPLTPLAAVQLTRNHDAIIDAVESFAGRKYKYESLNEFEQRYVRYPTEIVERVRTEASLSALEGLMVHMGGLREGRKNVLLISEGFSNYVPPELRRESEEPLAGRSRLVIPDSRIEQAMQRQSDHALSFDLERVFSAANRFNTTIYAFDPRGATVFEYDQAQAAVDPSTDRRVLRSTRDTLQILALETDGHAITDTRPVRPGLEQMLRDASTYYLLGYTSSHSATDGKYHEITVRVKRDGLNVRHRKGFWALTEREAERALGSTADEPPKAVDIAIAALAAPRQGRRLVRTWVGAARGEDGTSRVTFVWEPMFDRPSRGETPAGVLLTAMSETGGTPYRGRVPERRTPTSGGTRAGDAAGPRATRVEFPAEPGTLQLSVAVESEGGEVLDRQRDEIDVPDFASTDLTLSTPAFFRARNEMEWRAVVEDWEAMPTASREFRRTDRVLVRFEVYPPGGEQPAVRARLLNRGGEFLHPLDVQQTDGGHPYQADLRPAHLAPGEYVIELSVTSPTDDITKLIAFRLGS